MTTIKIENVSKIIHKQPVIRDVSAVLESGKIYGFQGINGSGKTMLMRLIAGLIRPTNGEIWIDDRLLGRDITFPQSLGLLIENPAFLDGYSGFQNLAMLVSIRNQFNELKVTKTLEQVGLEPEDKKKYRKYSLGMKQRLGIAAAILEEPDIVILDEPTNALDSDGVELVKKIVEAQKERGALVILSCHDASILQMMSDEIFVLESGWLKKRLAAPDFI